MLIAVLHLLVLGMEFCAYLIALSIGPLLFCLMSYHPKTRPFTTLSISLSVSRRIVASVEYASLLEKKWSNAVSLAR